MSSELEERMRKLQSEVDAAVQGTSAKSAETKPERRDGRAHALARRGLGIAIALLVAAVVVKLAIGLIIGLVYGALAIAAVAGLIYFAIRYVL